MTLFLWLDVGGNMGLELVTHLQSVWGLGAQTVCGRSMHGWSRTCPKNVTSVIREVTCKKCLNKISP